MYSGNFSFKNARNSPARRRLYFGRNDVSRQVCVAVRHRTQRHDRFTHALVFAKRTFRFHPVRSGSHALSPAILAPDETQVSHPADNAPASPVVYKRAPVSRRMDRE